mgnify:CR=1 FL=1
MEEILMLKNVSVFYGEHPVLKDVNMGIRPGRILAVMGPSGSGKTTLLRALNGLLWEEPEAEMKGEICLQGRDTRTMDREELRRRVGLVFQTPQPFPFSIYKNMTYAPRYYGIRKKEQLEEIVREKLMMAGLYEEVKGELSKSALKLSGGQKQRLCIARALLKKPKILILDDSTSAVDTTTDAKIRKAFREEIPDTTKLIIAQRISSVQDADRIIVMEEGCINGFDTHENLLKTNAIYREVYESQTKGGGDFDEKEGV